MDENTNSNSEVQNHITMLDETRIQKNAQSKYYRNIWGSYKGHIRGMLTGGGIGAVVGATLGLIALPIVGPIGIIAMTCASALVGAEGFGTVGATAAARSTSLAEKHARMLDPENAGDPIKTIDDKLMDDGAGNHYEFPTDRDKNKFFSFKSGLTGAAIGAASGALLAWGGVAFFVTALSGFGIPVIAAGAIIMGMFGLTFGVERGVFKSIFNHTDKNISGKIYNGHDPDLGKEQNPDLSDPELLAKRMERQDTIRRFEKEYQDKIFWGAATGRFKGFAGGAVTGGIVGLAAGAIALGIVALCSAHFLVAAATVKLLISCFAASGAFLGMNTFSEAGTQAGAESTSRAIDEEFERNRVLLAKGIAPTPGKKEKEEWFNWKSAALMGLIGIAVGIALAPILGPGVVFLLGHVGTATFGAAAAIPGTFSAATIGISAIISGVVGVSYGLGGKFLHGIGRTANKLYNNVYSNTVEENPGMTQTPSVSLPVRDKITQADAELLNSKMPVQGEKNFGNMVNQPSSIQVGM